MTVRNFDVYYWSSDSGNAEVDFIIDDGSEIVPLEVKAEVNLQSKSLRVYRDKFHPDISIRASMAEYKKDDGLLNLPLWAISKIRA